MKIYLSLGSNVGDRVGNLRSALTLIELEGMRALRISSFYETAPVNVRRQPWFMNCVAEVETRLSPPRLLARLQRIENDLGRSRRIPKGPRTIDIDILAYGNRVLRMPDLRIPHRRMAGRRFVLVPLCEVADGLRHPVTGRTVSEMLDLTPDSSPVVWHCRG